MMIMGKVIKEIKDFCLAFIGALFTYLDREEVNYYRICALGRIIHPFKAWKSHKWHRKYYHLE